MSKNSKVKMHSKETRALDKVIAMALYFITCVTLGKVGCFPEVIFVFYKLGIMTPTLPSPYQSYYEEQCQELLLLASQASVYAIFFCKV